jgi:large subunit ribosomal protein L3
MVDGDRGILVLRGAVPGPKGGVVTVENTVKAAK